MYNALGVRKDCFMKVGLSACSNGLDIQQQEQINELCRVFKTMGIETVCSHHIWKKTDAFSGTDRERGKDLMSFYQDDSIDAIYDITGGDLANGVLKFLDFDVISHSSKLLWGYSDLTTVLNAIYAKTGRPSVLYQVKNMISSKGDLQKKRFSDYINGKNQELFDIQYEFLQGHSMEGILVGGNIRCLLKLAGTEFWPDMRGKLLLLEAFGGESGVIASMLNQLDLLGVFHQVYGVLLGTFTKYEAAGLEMSVYDLLKMHISDSLPVAKTVEIGHGDDAKAVRIGGYMRLA